MDTQEKKYQAWAYVVQDMLNGYLAEKISDLDFNMNAIDKVYQKSIIKIIVTRLNRAFYNDEILPRDANVTYSANGGIQYSSLANTQPKDDIISFFDANERLLIETSGLMDQVIGNVDIDNLTTDLLETQFKGGQFVNDVDIDDYQKMIITINGQNVTVLQAIMDLVNGKANTQDVAKAIQTAALLDVTPTGNLILNAANK